MASSTEEPSEAQPPLQGSENLETGYVPYKRLVFASGVAAVLMTGSLVPSLNSQPVVTAFIESMLIWLDYFGTAVFAVAGTLKACRVGKMDLVGCLLMGTCTGVGGGTVRDVLLGRFPVSWLVSTEYLWICLFTSGITFLATHLVVTNNLSTPQRFKSILDWSDAIGLGAFAVIGAQAGVQAGMPRIIAATFGMMTATFGGLVRDICCFVPPVVLNTREPYASAAFLGAIVFLVGMDLTGSLHIGIIWGFVATVAIRVISFTFDLQVPAPPVYWRRQ